MPTSSGQCWRVMKMHDGHCPPPAAVNQSEMTRQGASLCSFPLPKGTSLCLFRFSKYRFCRSAEQKNDSWCFTDLRPIASDLSTSKIRSRQWTQGKSDKAISSATVCPLLWPACLLSLLVTVAKNNNQPNTSKETEEEKSVF